MSRRTLDASDLSMIGAVTLSSMPKRRREVILAFMHQEGKALKVKDVSAATGISDGSAEALMQEMDWLQLANFTKPGNGLPSLLSLRKDWQWIATSSFRQLLLDALAWQNPRIRSERRAPTRN